MKIGYVRVSKADGSQILDSQIDALKAAGVNEKHIYSDKQSGALEDRPGLKHCLQALRPGDVLHVWQLDRLGRNLKHLVNIVDELNSREIGLKILSGSGSHIDTTTKAGRMMFGIFAVLAEYERNLIAERTKQGLIAARARGRVGGRQLALAKNQVIYLQDEIKRGTPVSEICKDLNIARNTAYKYVGPTGELRERGQKVLGKKGTVEAKKTRH